MKPRELVLRRFELHRDGRSVSSEIADVRPIQHLDGPVVPIKSLWHQPSEKTLKTYVSARDPPAIARVDKLYIVYAYDPLSVNVDQLVVEDVFSQQDLALASLERRKVELRTAEP